MSCLLLLRLKLCLVVRKVNFIHCFPMLLKECIHYSKSVYFCKLHEHTPPGYSYFLCRSCQLLALHIALFFLLSASKFPTRIVSTFFSLLMSPYFRHRSCQSLVLHFVFFLLFPLKFPMTTLYYVHILFIANSTSSLLERGKSAKLSSLIMHNCSFFECGPVQRLFFHCPICAS